MVSALTHIVRSAFDKGSGAVAYILKTTLLSLLVVWILLQPTMILKYELLRQIEPEVEPVSFLFALVLTPLIENLVFIGLIEFMMAFELRKFTMITTIAILSGIAHAFVAEWRGISGVILFATMSYTYLDWYDSPFTKRYLMTVSQHVLFNTPATLLAAASFAG